jgi:tetratricopeptide (TPR) repeat protein
MQTGSFDKAIDSATRAVELSGHSGNIGYAARALVSQQFSYLYKADFDKVFGLKEDVLRMMAEQFDLLTYVRSFLATSIAFTWCGRWDEAIKNGEKALNVSQHYSANSQISNASNFIALSSAFKGDLKRAIEYGEMAVKSAPSPAYLAWAQCTLAYTWCRAGEFDKGIEILNFYVQIFRAGHSVFSEIHYAACLAEGYLLAGKYDKAEQISRENLELTERCGAKFFIGWNNLLLAEVAMEKDFSQASTHLEKCITIFKETKAENMLAKAYAAFGRLYKKQGDVVQAREYLTKALEIFTRLGTLIDPDKVKKELADLSPVHE